jgi:biopolymer transport protein ExbD
MNEIQDRDKIKPYNATKYLRQMKYLPDTTPFCGILLVLLFIFSPYSHQIGGSRLMVPKVKYANHEPLLNNDSPNIHINEDGEFNFMGKYGKNIDELPAKFADVLKENQSDIKNHKVFLTIDGYVPWGKVCDVMKVLKDNQIKVIGLITQGTTSFVDFYEQQKLYREKGLRLPESAR